MIDDYESENVERQDFEKCLKIMSESKINDGILYIVLNEVSISGIALAFDF